MFGGVLALSPLSGFCDQSLRLAVQHVCSISVQAGALVLGVRGVADACMLKVVLMDSCPLIFGLCRAGSLSLLTLSAQVRRHSNDSRCQAACERACNSHYRHTVYVGNLITTIYRKVATLSHLPQTTNNTVHSCQAF